MEDNSLISDNDPRRLMPNHVTVVAAVIEKDGKVLIGKRIRSFMGHPWEFPGGKIEPGETPEECLKREIREELGVEIQVTGLICTAWHIYDCQTSIELLAYGAVHLSDEFTLVDHEEIRWVPVRDLNLYSFPEADYAVLQHLMKERATGNDERSSVKP